MTVEPRVGAAACTLAALLLVGACSKQRTLGVNTDSMRDDAGTPGASSQVSAGELHTCLRDVTGRVWCWGDDTFAQLGDGDRGGRASRPSAVMVLDDARDLHAGTNHTCAQVGEGEVWCWGHNLGGGLGDGTLVGARDVPVRVVDLPPAVDVSAGFAFSCAATGDGRAYCWGPGDFGRLGDGTSTDTARPVQVLGSSGAEQVCAGGNHACALVSGGEVRCWGRNHVGQLGDGTTTDRTAATPVSGMGDAVHIDCGGNGTCAATESGEVRCWGQVAGTSSTTPTALAGIDQAAMVSISSGHACALLTSGQIACWGDNSRGQLGDPGAPGGAMVTIVPGLASAISVAAGLIHTCAVESTGQTYCWGANFTGQLGDGTTFDHPTPTPIATP